MWGSEKLRVESAKAFAIVYFMQQGTPFIYQGQEIGMTNPCYSHIDDYEDVGAKNEYYEGIANGISAEEMIERLKLTSRVNSRSPMQWDMSRNAGFSIGNPWAKVNKNYKKINVQLEQEDENSILNFYKKMIRLRSENETLILGKYNLLMENHKEIYAFTRTLENERYLVIANLSEKRPKYKSPFMLKKENLLLNNYDCNEECVNEFLMKPYECRLYKVGE